MLDFIHRGSSIVLWLRKHLCQDKKISNKGLGMGRHGEKSASGASAGLCHHRWIMILLPKSQRILIVGQSHIESRSFVKIDLYPSVS